jgi:hypothetical protein
MRDRDNTTRTGAKDPWGREAEPLEQRPVETRAGRDAEPVERAAVEAGEGWCKPWRCAGMLGASLTASRSGKTPSDMLALKPYRGKLAVRNFRGDDGNVGIIRSPVRAIVLPDHGPSLRRSEHADHDPHVGQAALDRLGLSDNYVKGLHSLGDLTVRIGASSCATRKSD